MSRNSVDVCRIFWIGTMVFSLVGCQALMKDKPENKDTLKEIQLSLAEGVQNNQRIAEKSVRNVPESVTKALIPDSSIAKEANSIRENKRFSVSADKVPARDFFMGLVNDTPYNIVVHPNVTGSVSMELTNVTVKDVLEAVRNVYGYDYEFNQNSIQVFSPKLQTRAFKINYLHLNRAGTSDTTVSSGGLGTVSNSGDNGSSGTSNSNTNDTTATLQSRITTTSAANFWAELKIAVEILVGEDEGRKVAISPMSGLIVVQAMPHEIRKVQEFLDSAQLALDKQVILEAKVLEVQLNDGFQAGINWGFISGGLRTVQQGSSVIGATVAVPELVTSSRAGTGLTMAPGNNSVASLGSNLNTASAFGGVFSVAMNFNNISSFIELLSSQGKVQVLSSPRVSTTNNQKALIKVGTDKFFITNIQAPNVISSGVSVVNTLPDITFETFFSGVALDVTPQISQNNYITLHVHPTISEVVEENKQVNVAGQAQNFPLASSTVRETDSIVRAKSGQVVVIGGLMQNKNNEIDAGIPVLKNLPGIGKLFQHKRIQTSKSELVILIRPIVVDNDEWTDELENSMDRFQKIGGDVMFDRNSMDKYFKELDEKMDVSQ